MSADSDTPSNCQAIWNYQDIIMHGQQGNLPHPHDRVKVLDQGKLFISKDHLALFKSNNLYRFETLMQHPGDGIAKKVLEERYTLRLELKTASGDTELYFLKKYLPAGGRKPAPAAFAEWRAMWLFKNDDIPGPEPAALAVDWDGACVISKAVPHVMKLDQWAYTYLLPKISSHSRLKGLTLMKTLLRPATSYHARQIRTQSASLPTDTRRDALVKALATITGRLHNAAMCHQDLYLCHFLCATQEHALPLTLIDVQRVRKFAGVLPIRWQIKDLAQLYFSSRKFITGNDVRKFWRRYTDVNKRNRIPSCIILPLVILKAHRIQRHTLRHNL